MIIFDADIESIKRTWLRRTILIVMTPMSIIVVLLMYMSYVYWKIVFYKVWKGKESFSNDPNFPGNFKTSDKRK